MNLADNAELLLLLSVRSSGRSFSSILVALSLSEEDSLAELRLLIVKIDSLLLLYSSLLRSLLDWGMLSISKDLFWEEVEGVDTTLIVSDSRGLSLLV